MSNLDFETYSEADLLKVGGWRYSEDSSTEVICLQYSLDSDGRDGEPHLWTPDMPQPKALFDAINAGEILHAFNSFFEWSIWHNCLKWPLVPIGQWRDTAAQAAASAMPRKLGDVAIALGLPADQQKSKRGTYLIQRLCKPYRGERVRDPELIQELIDYCRQDVITERAVGRRLKPLSEFEQRVWELDQKANIRGIRVDVATALNANAIRQSCETQASIDINKVTQGRVSSVSKVADIKTYLNSRGMDVTSLAKETVSDLLKEPDLDDKCRKVLQLRADVGKSSVAKYDKLVEIASTRGRLHGLLRYHGAATGRWSGNLFQPQNLPRPLAGMYDMDAVIHAINTCNMDVIELSFGNPMDALVSGIRGMLTADEGKQLFISDYAAIEARVVAWLAGQEDLLDVFRDHGKIYEYTASQIYGTPWQDVGPDERFIGKVASLALGFQGAKGAFLGMAGTYGVEIPETKAVEIVNNWREANDKIVSLWEKFDTAAGEAITEPGVTFPVETAYTKIGFRYDGKWLIMQLPSGRKIRWFNPKIELVEKPWGKALGMTYYGLDSTKGLSWRKMNTYGGDLVQSATQATARDIMANAMVNLDANGFEVLLTVHDEVISQAGPDRRIEEYNQIMLDSPTWAAGLPVGAEGFTSHRYRKD